MDIGDVYDDGKLSVLIIDRDEDIYFIAIAKITPYFRAQTSFVPVHKRVLEEFTDSMFPTSTGVIPSSISDSKEKWLTTNNGSKNYFVIRVEDIWNVLIGLLEKNGKTPKDYLCDGWVLLPICFPVNDSVNENGCMYLDLKGCGEAYEQKKA